MLKKWSDNMSNIHTNIKVLREEARLSQAEFAEKLGVTIETVKLWEKGKLDPTDTEIIKMCPILRIHKEDFLERDILSERNDAGSRMKKGSVRKNYNWYYGNRLTMAFYISYLIVIPIVAILTSIIMKNYLDIVIDSVISGEVMTPEDYDAIINGANIMKVMSILLVMGFISAIYAVCYVFKKGILRFQYWYVFWLTPIVIIGTTVGIIATPCFYVYAIYKGIIKKGKNR